MAREILEADVSKVYTDQNLKNQFWLGAVYETRYAKFVFVKYDDGDGNVAGTAGLLCYQIGSASTDYAPFVVTCDYNSATVVALLQSSVGILQATLADGEYGWAQFEGFGQKDITTDGSVTVGSRLMAGSADGTVVNHDAGAKLDIGVALETDPASGATTTLAAGKYRLNIPI
jgi:hypothetical protein